VVNFPPRGIGARSLEQLQDAARTAGCSLHDAVSSLSGKAGANLSAFVAKIDVVREQTEGATLREIIDLVLQHSGLLDHYRADRDGADRVENLEELVNAAESFVLQEGFGKDAVALPVDETGALLTQSPVSQGLDPNVLAQDLGSIQPDTGETLSPLVAFLTHAALESGDNQAQAGQDAVQLMTVHAAKGLEFDAVFITGLEEGLFPHENSLSDRDGLEEERRLMYVAITRARKRLYLSHAVTRMLHGQTRYNLRSRFLDELPEACLKWLSPRQAAQAGLGSGFGSGGAASSGWNSQPAWGRSSLGNNTPSASGRTSSAYTGAGSVPAQKAEPAHGIRAGMAVFHNKFGEGKVLTVEGQGDDARAQVSFLRHGTKWLALSVAKLTPI
jgi:DNA helicase-2/ATP-dependent DNA helicase PcrA